MRDILRQGLSELGLTPPDGAVDRLERYAQLLLEKNRVMNLTAITEPEEVARLHFLDAAAVLSYLRGEAGADGALSVIDVGTGAGFPGLVLKILAPELQVTLLDATGKRVDWLGEVCEVLSLDGVRCVHGRAEELALTAGYRDRYDVAVSRAVAAYPALCELCLPFLRVGGRFLAMKSVESAAEARAGQSALRTLGGRALPSWDYPIPGTAVVHRLVAAEKASPTPAGYPRSWGKIKKAPL